ncbi:lymphoid-specific helicase [Sardina pilchardus]|uniref:lymphoid-specific helicase n=1 Tax=Sardina pilchardus TaxID=27697 RepID=UPI002E14F010
MNGVKEESRSVSPHCPKPNESEEPEGTAMEETDPGAAVKVEGAEFVITKEMEEEEKLAREAGEKREQAMMEEARQSWEKETKDMRFKRLQHLLDKSNIYAKFLLTKMELQQQEENVRNEKLEKKAQTQASKGKGKDKKTDKVDRKKREREEDYKIADVMSKEEIMSKAKKAKVDEEEVPTAGRKLEAEDIEKLSDSNAEIKNRLSEAVRENAKHLLDPERQVDGKPVPAQQPKLFTGGVMRWYQVEGIEWLRMLWENGINGILADEMGLGKTIQCIGHVAMMLERKVLGPFLIVVPLSTVPNWISEFKRFAPDISVMLYHGAAKERDDLIKLMRKPQGPLKMCPVVITSFEIAMIDRRKLQRFHWKFLIVDEGHRIKNLNCRLVRELKLLNTDNKLLLTGTPLQNNLAELWSLLNFLLPDVFDDLKSFESWFDLDRISEEAENIVAKEREENILHMLHQILTPFLLRRLKSDVTLEVPPKREILVYAPLTLKQETLYSAIINKTIAKMLGKDKQEEGPVVLSSAGRPRRRTRREVDYAEKAGEDPDALENQLEKHLEKMQKEMDQRGAPEVEVKSLDAHINLKMRNVLMLVRKCCNHPYLIEYPLDPATDDFKIDEQLVETSGKFLILDRMLPELKKRGHKVLVFSQMTSILDLLMDYCYLRGYQYSRLDGTMAYTDRADNMKKFTEDPEVFLFLLSTRAGGLGINLTAADTVIIFDSDWNPQADLQAQDRCHRIGQTKPVLVFRLVTANTIDQRIVERAAAKRKLEKMVIHKNKFKGGADDLKPTKNVVNESELMDLLKSRDYEKAVKSTKGKVISDKDLEFLLDRSDLLVPDQEKKQSRKQEKDGVFRVVEAKQEDEITLS